MKKILKKMFKHLSSDRKMFKHEAKEDKKLQKEIKEKVAKKPVKKVSKNGKKY